VSCPPFPEISEQRFNPFPWILLAGLTADQILDRQQRRDCCKTPCAWRDFASAWLSKNFRRKCPMQAASMTPCWCSDCLEVRGSKW
jgi:hypothetical protein